MFKNPPNIYAHSSALQNGHFVTEDEIIFKKDEKYSIKSRECPHRGYIMQEPGDIVKNVICKLHGFSWDDNGKPLNNSLDPCRNHFYKLHHHGELELGTSGLLFQNFKEDLNWEWIKALSKETDLEFNRTLRGESNGSWLWFQEQLTDVLHLRPNGIHPRQSLETPLELVVQGFEEEIVTQTYTLPTGTVGYWVYIFPWIGIEFEPGKLLINRIIPKDINNEFGFNWELQLYYDPQIDKNEREEWEKCIEVYREDLEAIEKIRRPFFPLKRQINDLERQMYQWGQWYLKNKINDTDSQK
jgi:nitrite reductase/ring-hydroxylating ferredoxin subunit